MYFVYIINEKYISWEFCMRVIMGIFYKSEEEALAITEEILSEGEGLCGVYNFEIAESKAKSIEHQAKQEGMSMRCLLEEV